KATNIRKIEMKFIGKAKTFWVAGLGSEQQAYTEKRETINHQIHFLSSPAVEDSSQHGKFEFKNLTKFKDRSATNTFSAGSHVYPFEIFIPGDLPETVKAEHGSVKYKLIAEVSRSMLRSKLVKKCDIKVIRISPDYEVSEGIALSKDYDSTFNYEVSIPQSAYPLGQTIPIEVKIIPLVKNLKVHGMLVELLEESIYTANGLQAGVTKVVSTLNVDNLNHSQDQDDDDMVNISYHENLSFSVPNEINCSMNTPLINISHVLKFCFIVTLPHNSGQDSRTRLFVRCPITIVSCTEVGRFFDLPNYEEKYCSCGPEYQRVARLVLGETATEGYDCSGRAGNIESGTTVT
ncbi:1606_t:CDS:2, partial [Acaulospora morrowiae]